MFFPKAMSEIELIVPAKDLVKVMRVLSGHGVFHQVEASSSGLQTDTISPSTWHDAASAYAGLERRIQALVQVLGVEAGPPGAVDLPDVSEPGSLSARLEALESKVRQVTDQLTDQRKHLEQLESDLRQLEPVAGIDFNLGTLQESRFLYQRLGVIPAENLSRLQTSLSRIPHIFLTLRDDPKRPVVWLAGSQTNKDVLERATRSAYLEALSLPRDYGNTPAEISTSLRREVEVTRQRISEADNTLRLTAEEYRTELQDLWWQIHANRTIADAIVRFGHLRHSYVMVGWVPTDDVEALTRRLRQNSAETLIEAVPANRIGNKERVPVALQQSKFLRPFQLLVTTYARPKYGELDPTWLIALTFPLLFGAMFGDVGHGLLLVVLGILVSARRIAFLRSLASLGGLITVCGAVSTAFGFLYGSVFGFENVLRALWLRPGNNPLQILMVAIGAGVALLSLGFLIGIFNAVVSRDWPHLFFGHNGIPGLVLYWSLIAYGAAKLGTLRAPSFLFGLLALLAGLVIMFSELLMNLVEGERPLVEGGVGTYAIQAPMELFEAVISFLSNSLSYVRVGAFAIAHVVLSSVVFLLAQLVSPGHGAGYWIVVAIGTVFIVGYEGLIVGIQAMRLSYYEFFSKFFTGGGMRFEPLTLAASVDD
jgi:V/A-type H+-transporting ATPase subunit I